MKIFERCLNIDGRWIKEEATKYLGHNFKFYIFNEKKEMINGTDDTI